MLGFLFSSVPICAQLTEDAFNKNLSSNIVYTYDQRYEGVKGSPFLFDEWISGKVDMYYSESNQSSTISDVEIKLDIYSHLALVSPKNANQVIQLNNGIQALFLYHNQDTLEYQLVELGEGPQFARKLTHQEPILFEVYLKTLRKADYKGLYSANRTYDEFIPKSTIHIRKGDQMFKAKSSQKFWTKLYPQHRQMINDFWKNEVSGKSISVLQIAEGLGQLIDE